MTPPPQGRLALVAPQPPGKLDHHIRSRASQSAVYEVREAGLIFFAEVEVSFGDLNAVGIDQSKSHTLVHHWPSPR